MSILQSLLSSLRCLLPTRLRRCRSAAEANRPGKDVSSLAAFLRSVTQEDLKKREKTEGVSGAERASLARLIRQALELRWERCRDFS